MKIIFMGTPDFAVPVFKKLMESKHEVVAVYTQKPREAGRGMKLKKSKIHELADMYHLEVHTPDSLKNDEEIIKFRGIKADLAIVAAYGLLLPEEVLVHPKKGSINIHPSLLPRWRGAAPIQRTIMAGDTKTGVCIMKMDVGLDSGDVIIKEEFNIPDVADAGWLHDYSAERGAILTMKALDLIETGKAIYTKQAEEGVTYARKITKDVEKIDFTKTGEEILNQIRGLSPYPGANFTNDDVKYKIFEAEFVPLYSNEKQAKQEAGNTDAKLKDKFYIKCANGMIIPKIIQKEGKQRMRIEEFLKGNKSFVGKIVT